MSSGPAVRRTPQAFLSPSGLQLGTRMTLSIRIDSVGGRKRVGAVSRFYVMMRVLCWLWRWEAGVSTRAVGRHHKGFRKASLLPGGTGVAEESWRDMTGTTAPATHRLEGRTAWVTTGSGAAGRVAASTLARAGANVAVGFIAVPVGGASHHDFRLRSADALDAMLDAVAITGRRGIGGQLDLYSAEARERFADHVRMELGQISILVNVLSMEGRDPTREARPAGQTLDAQLEGMLRVIDLLTPAMIERAWGRIITIVEVRDGTRDALEQAMTAQASLQSLTRGMALDLTPRGVGCFLIGPGMSADPAKLATLILALCADEAVTLSGQTVALSAGGTATG